MSVCVCQTMLTYPWRWRVIHRLMCVCVWFRLSFLQIHEITTNKKRRRSKNGDSRTRATQDDDTHTQTKVGWQCMRTKQMKNENNEKKYVIWNINFVLVHTFLVYIVINIYNYRYVVFWSCVFAHYALRTHVSTYCKCVFKSTKFAPNSSSLTTILSSSLALSFTHTHTLSPPLFVFVSHSLTVIPCSNVYAILWFKYRF